MRSLKAVDSSESDFPNGSELAAGTYKIFVHLCSEEPLKSWLLSKIEYGCKAELVKASSLFSA